MPHFQLPARTHNNTTTTGFINIILELLKVSKLNLIGRTAEDKAEVLQWLEYAIVYAVNTDAVQTANHILTVKFAQSFESIFVTDMLFLGT